MAIIYGMTSGVSSGGGGSSGYLDYNSISSSGSSSGSGTSNAGPAVTWSNVGVGLTLAGGLVGVASTLYSARASAKLYKQQAEQVLSDAQLQTQFDAFNNMLTQEAYAVDRKNLQTQQREHLASMHVGFAAEGIEMTGSARLVMAVQAQKDAEELQTLDKNAQLASFQTQLNSTATLIKADYQSKMLKIQAKYAKRSGYLNAFSQGMSTLGSAAFMYGGGSISRTWTLI